MKKTPFLLAIFTLLAASQAHATGALPVFSSNGFVCGKDGITVTCKGNLPGGNGSITGTGHDMVYLTVNVQQEGKPTRYTYFSDTGCLIGYTFGASGQPQEAVASHRGGNKKTFDLSDGRFEKLVEYCTPEQGAVPVAKESSGSAPTPATTALPKASTAKNTPSSK